VVDARNQSTDEIRFVALAAGSVISVFIAQFTFAFLSYLQSHSHPACKPPRRACEYEGLCSNGYLLDTA